MKEFFRIKIERVLDDLTVDELANVLKSYNKKSVANAGHNIKIEEHYYNVGNLTNKYCVTLYDVIKSDKCDSIPMSLVARVHDDLKDIPVETRDKVYIRSLIHSLSTRAYNALLRAGYETLNELEGLTRKEASRIRDIGYASLCELEEVMEVYGFKFKEEK